jgi:hypothetical protein
MEEIKVGPFTVRGLTVGEGLPLLALAQKEDKGDFQNALLMATVSKDGKSIAGESFGELIPLLGEIIKASMMLNGFASKDEE